MHPLGFWITPHPSFAGGQTSRVISWRFRTPSPAQGFRTAAPLASGPPCTRVFIVLGSRCCVPACPVSHSRSCFAAVLSLVRWVAASLASVPWAPVALPPPHHSDQTPLQTRPAVPRGTPNHPWVGTAALSPTKPTRDGKSGSLPSPLLLLWASAPACRASLPTAAEGMQRHVPRPPRGNVAEPLKQRPAPWRCSRHWSVVRCPTEQMRRVHK